jgi:MFS transporter, OCT family, solute carrier family 22 (organic cation transporter), member 4/5
MLLLFIVFIMKFVPESPRYFVASGRSDKAQQILKTIALTNKRSLPEGKLLDINARVGDQQFLICSSIRSL